MSEPLSDAERVELLEEMVRIRQFEDRIRELFANNELPGFVHLYTGMEAIAAGCCAPLNDDDYITSTHRGHGHAIAKGLDLDGMMAELFGRRTGLCKGKGGSMHLADLEKGMLGANGIVAAGTPIAGGAALASDIRDTDQVSVSFLGDGATSNGPYHEAIHLAATWDLPQIYVIENNFYGEMTSTEVQHPSDDLVGQAKAYDIPGEEINGQDVETVYETLVEAVDRARAGNGPTLIECKSYRFRGHYEGDPEWYREDEDLPDWRTSDPIEEYRERLLADDVLTPEEFERIEARVEQEIDEAVEFARDSPMPDPEEAYDDVYAEEL